MCNWHRRWVRRICVRQCMYTYNILGLFFLDNIRWSGAPRTRVFYGVSSEDVYEEEETESDAHKHPDRGEYETGLTDRSDARSLFCAETEKHMIDLARTMNPYCSKVLGSHKITCILLQLWATCARLHKLATDIPCVLGLPNNAKQPRTIARRPQTQKQQRIASSPNTS